MKEITLEQIIFAGLLYLESVDRVSLELLTDELQAQHFKLVNKEPIALLEYVHYDGKKYVLKDGYTLSTEISEGYTLKDELENIATTCVLDVVSNIDLKLFTLKKLKRLSNPKVSEIRSLLSPVELTNIGILSESHAIAKMWEGLAPYDEEQQYYITKIGEVALYMDENKEDIKTLIVLLEALRYNPDLIPEFLATKNLDNFQITAETVVDFDVFCSIYDRDPRGRKQA